jgi:hypothetical protein
LSDTLKRHQKLHAGGPAKAGKRSSKSNRSRSDTNYETAPSDQSTDDSLHHSPVQEDEAVEPQFAYDALGEWSIQPLFINDSFNMYTINMDGSGNYFGDLYSSVELSPVGTIGSECTDYSENLWKLMMPLTRIPKDS